MGLFNFGKAKGESPEELAERAKRAESEATQKAAQLEELRELVRHLDEDRLLLLRAAMELRPGMDPKALGQALLEICFKPLGLASFYLALIDWDRDRITFPVYHEGGRLRNQPERPFLAEREGGLTGKAVLSGNPLYISTLEEGRRAGAIFSEAERISGLVPQSWYGVPLGGERGFGLVSFQSFHQEAFPDSRRRLMDALAAIVAMALKAAPARTAPGG
ncbi:MAG TPA: GAF domain-containing protein [Holophagaceae bacterium]|nr:GAF domain-containing protein [Holophagaceae bacterium]